MVGRKQVLLFSPNHLFSDYISMVLPSLGESEVPTRTFHHFIQLILTGYEVTKETQQEETFLSGDDDAIEKSKVVFSWWKNQPLCPFDCTDRSLVP